jgi:phosphatidylglycerol:prolipoprotein diacylglycerol transferase
MVFNPKLPIIGFAGRIDTSTYSFSFAKSGRLRFITRLKSGFQAYSTTKVQGKLETTEFLPQLAGIPAVIPGIWPVLGAVAVLLAIVIQRVLLPHENVAVEVPLIVPLAALAAGLLGAKVWYAVLHPGPWRKAILGGWAVDGFLVVAPIVAIAILLALGLPVAKFLDAVTPGLFVAVAIGRIGCFFAGCCAGRITDSRWGIWSSDRKIGARRIPAQILESLAGLAIAAITTLLILGHAPRIDGTIFIGALAVYLVVRQALLRVRAERREFLWRRTAAV